MLPWLLQHGVHPDCRLGADGNTPLMQAACKNELDTMRLLIDAGADVKARNEENETPLGFACAWNQWKAAELLIDCGADVNAIVVDDRGGDEVVARAFSAKLVLGVLRIAVESPK